MYISNKVAWEHLPYRTLSSHEMLVMGWNQLEALVVRHTEVDIACLMQLLSSDCDRWWSPELNWCTSSSTYCMHYYSTKNIFFFIRHSMQFKAWNVSHYGQFGYFSHLPPLSWSTNGCRLRNSPMWYKSIYKQWSNPRGVCTRVYRLRQRHTVISRCIIMATPAFGPPNCFMHCEIWFNGWKCNKISILYMVIRLI